MHAGENGEKIPNQQSEELSILIMGSKGSVRSFKINYLSKRDC